MSHIKNEQPLTNMTKSRNTKLSYLEGWLSIAINILLFGLKYWAGIVSGSIAIIADAWHTLSDSISSIFLLIGAKVSEKPPDERHPFGHGRAELITAILIGMFLAFVAYEFISESIERLHQKPEFHYGIIAIVVTILSIISKEGLAQFAFWAFRRTHSNALRADAWHHRSDAFSSLIILVGIFLGRFFWWIDAVLGIIVAMLILYSAFEIIREAVDPLMGKIPDKSTLREIKALCLDISGRPLRAHHFHLHEYGDHAELTFHLVFPRDYTLLQAHTLANELELTIRDKLNIEATIHMEPEGEEHDYFPEKNKFM